MSHVGYSVYTWGTYLTVCVVQLYSSRRRWDSGHAGPRSLTTRRTTTRPYIIKRGGGSGGSGGGGGASALARAAAGAGGNAEGGGGGRWWGWGGGGALAGVRDMKVWGGALLGRLQAAGASGEAAGQRSTKHVRVGGWRGGGCGGRRRDGGRGHGVRGHSHGGSGGGRGRHRRSERGRGRGISRGSSGGGGRWRGRGCGGGDRHGDDGRCGEGGVGRVGGADWGGLAGVDDVRVEGWIVGLGGREAGGGVGTRRSGGRRVAGEAIHVGPRGVARVWGRAVVVPVVNDGVEGVVPPHTVAPVVEALAVVAVTAAVRVTVAAPTRVRRSEAASVARVPAGDSGRPREAEGLALALAATAAAVAAARAAGRVVVGHMGGIGGGSRGGGSDGVGGPGGTIGGDGGVTLGGDLGKGAVIAYTHARRVPAQDTHTRACAPTDPPPQGSLHIRRAIAPLPRHWQAHTLAAAATAQACAPSSPQFLGITPIHEGPVSRGLGHVSSTHVSIEGICRSTRAPTDVWPLHVPLRRSAATEPRSRCRSACPCVGYTLAVTHPARSWAFFRAPSLRAQQRAPSGRPV